MLLTLSLPLLLSHFCHSFCHFSSHTFAFTGATDLNAVDVLIANPLRLKCLEEEGKVDLSKVCMCVCDVTFCVIFRGLNLACAAYIGVEKVSPTSSPT